LERKRAVVQTLHETLDIVLLLHDRRVRYVAFPVTVQWSSPGLSAGSSGWMVNNRRSYFD